MIDGKEAETLKLEHRRDHLRDLITLEIEDIGPKIATGALCYVGVNDHGGDVVYGLCRYLEASPLGVTVYSYTTGKRCRVDPHAVRVVLGKRSEVPT